MKAVIPAAGLGTRFLPATKAQPKEMLPVIDKPAIQYVVEEVIKSGINDIVIITGKGKRSIEDHFDRALELESFLNGKNNAAKNSLNIVPEDVNIYYVRQKIPRGLGHAVYHAKTFIDGENFAVLLGDDIIDSDRPCIKQLMDIHEDHQAPIIGIERVRKTDVTKYGIIQAKPKGSNTYSVEGLVEKPSIDEAPSDLAVVGRYVLTPDIFDILKDLPPGKDGEIQLTDALNTLANRRELIAYLFEGRRYDLGNKFDYLRASIELGLKRDDIGPELSGYLRNLARDL